MPFIRPHPGAGGGPPGEVGPITRPASPPPRRSRDRRRCAPAARRTSRRPAGRILRAPARSPARRETITRPSASAAEAGSATPDAADVEPGEVGRLGRHPRDLRQPLGEQAAELRAAVGERRDDLLEPGPARTVGGDGREQPERRDTVVGHVRDRRERLGVGGRARDELGALEAGHVPGLGRRRHGGHVLGGALDRRVGHVRGAREHERRVDLVADHAGAVPQRRVAQRLELGRGPRAAERVVRGAQQHGAGARGERGLDRGDVQAPLGVEGGDGHEPAPGQRDDVQQGRVRRHRHHDGRRLAQRLEGEPDAGHDVAARDDQCRVDGPAVALGGEGGQRVGHAGRETERWVAEDAPFDAGADGVEHGRARPGVHLGDEGRQHARRRERPLDRPGGAQRVVRQVERVVERIGELVGELVGGDRAHVTHPRTRRSTRRSRRAAPHRRRRDRARADSVRSTETHRARA